MIDIQLTSNFRLSEFIQSDIADKLPALKIKQELISYDVLSNIIEVAHHLQRIRDDLGFPIYISSGYRCPELNRKVKGVGNSAHLKGLAVDMYHIDILDNGHDALIKSCQIVDFDQLIVYDNFVHIGFTNKMTPRRQIIEKRTSVLR